MTNELNFNDSQEHYSKEMKTVMDFMNNTLFHEIPVLVIDANYFILASLAHSRNYLFDILDESLTTNAMKAIYDSFYQVVSSKSLTAVKPDRKPSFNAKFKDYLTDAHAIMETMGEKELTTIHVFLSILNEDNEDNKIRKVFNKAGLTYGVIKHKWQSFITNDSDNISMEEITEIEHYKERPNQKNNGIKIIKLGELPKDEFLDMMSQINNNVDDMGEVMNVIGGKKKNKNYISSYCNNLNQLAISGKMDPLIGRDKEISEIIRVLGRRKKNNVILLGGEGVGKTAIGESLAFKIVNGDVPEFLMGRELVSLDMTALMAGTTLRGMFEERVKGILDDIKANPKYILFMDNIGAILADKGKNDYEISAMLARSLENGEIQVVGTSDFTSYRKTFDKDPSLARRFQKIIVEAPSVNESLNILMGIRESYEDFHHVKYDDDAIKACVSLSYKYITERNLPDSAIDILDEVGALKGTIQDSEEIKNIRKQLLDISNSIHSAQKEKNYEKIDELEKEYKKINSTLNNIKHKIEEERKINPICITKDDILDIVSIKTNIPVNSLTSDDKKKLVNMNERIKEDVIGQDEAIDKICKALKRNRIGLHKHGCMYSFMSIGKTGVGKTLIAKRLAKELFGDEKALVRFDMSEFSDKVAVNKLIGSNPGYVGYEEGGQLTETIKNKKHCVLLLDEIEKADPEIYNIFLQVLDEGFLTDNSGQKVDFKNVIVIFTSNIGAKTANDFGRGIGFKEDVNENSRKILLKELKKKFPPEFLNRIDDIIYFNSLKDEDLKKIIDIEIKKFQKRILEIGYYVKYSDDIIEYIFNIVKDEKEYGARPITRAIQDTIEDKLTDVLLLNEYENGHSFNISCVSDLSEIVVA